MPDRILEPIAAMVPPIYLSRIKGGQSPTTGQCIEGHLITLGATPRQMMSRPVQFTYSRLIRAARIAQSHGARIMGLGAFSSVIGDAGATVARQAGIAVTTGNSLAVALTFESVKQAAARMGMADLAQCQAMVIGATGSIGSVCARLLAQITQQVTLVSTHPERLLDLQQQILQETPTAKVRYTTQCEDYISECHVIVTATSAIGQRVLNITHCQPGAVICDVARPYDISPEEAAARPDVLVIESSEAIVPGNLDVGYDIGLPPQIVYACMAETALLAMEGRFENYTLGRNISIERVKEIYTLFNKHQFQLAGLRSFGKFLTDDEIDAKRQLANALRGIPGKGGTR